METTDSKAFKAPFTSPRMDIEETRTAELANLVDQIKTLSDRFNRFVDYVNEKLASIT